MLVHAHLDSRQNRSTALVVLMALAIIVPVAAFGQNTPVIWGGGNGNWFPVHGQTSHWFFSPGGVPVAPPNGPGFTANIGTGSGTGNILGSVTVNAPVNLPNGVSLGNGAPGGLQVISPASTLEAGTLDLGFSGPGTSTLTVSGGGVVTDSFASIGVLAGSSGSASVSGTGSQWTVSKQFFIGDNGQGTLNIGARGTVRSSNAIIGDIGGSSGAVTVAGTGAQWTDSAAPVIGSSGHGTLTVSNGGSVVSAGGIIATYPGSFGSALVTGAGSKWNNSLGLEINPNGTLQISKGGLINNGGGVFINQATLTDPGSQWNTAFAEICSGGTLSIQNGGAMNSLNGNGGGYIACFGKSGTVKVQGAGSQWNLPFLEVGSGGPLTGALLIDNGGLVNSGGTYIGTFTGSRGTATVTGTGSQWITSRQCVGCGGPGSLSIQAGGRGMSTSGLWIGYNSGVTGSMLVTDPNSKWADTGSITIGVHGRGSLIARNGGKVTTSGGLYLGYYSGSSGGLAVSGAGSQLIANSATIGGLGPGTVNVNSGGAVNIGAGGTGINYGASLTVSDPGSQWSSSGGVCVGCSSDGTLTAKAASNGSSRGLWVGFNTGVLGYMSLTDSKTVWTNSSGPVVIGEAGTGALNLESGAALLDSGDLTLGYRGKGTLMISGGAHVESDNASLGALTGSMGTATIIGVGSKWNISGSLLLGGAGKGIVNVTGGGAITAGGLTNKGLLSIGAQSKFIVNGDLTNFSGTTLKGGIYDTSGILQFDRADIVTNAANVTLTGATANIVDQSGNNAFTNFITNSSVGMLTLSGDQSLKTVGGSITNSGFLTIEQGSTLTVGNGGIASTAVNYTQTAGRTTVHGTLTSAYGHSTPILRLDGGSLFGTGTLDYASVVNASATLMPGDLPTSTGKLAISGTYTQDATGVLDIAIGGKMAGTQFDQLNVTGDLSLNGTLNISRINGFVPAIGDQFVIVTANSVKGAFAKVTGTAVNEDKHFQVKVIANEVVLTALAGAAD